MIEPRELHLFEAVGVELEYMIVDVHTLDVRPVADKLLADAARLAGSAGPDEAPGDAAFGPITWSNELVAHVLEFKTSGPVLLDDPAAFRSMRDAFAENVRRANALLAPRGACLLPTAMHPWMNPARETRLWPHEYREVYETFDRLFDCRSHGWANLQSMHLNLPFSGDEEFGRLHAAIRVLLPILPALAAGSPLMDGRLTGFLDNRLEVYRTNSSRVPSLAGSVIPERAFSREEYEETILDPIRRDLERLDPAGHLEAEFTNARGAIARFDRGTIEIRVLDVQEHPGADLAAAALIVDVLRSLAQERWCSLADLKRWSIGRLLPIFSDAIRLGEAAVIRDPDYLSLFGVQPGDEPAPVTAGELWSRLSGNRPEPAGRHVTLARRIVEKLNGSDLPAALPPLYRRLADCLEQDTPFAV